MTAPTHGRPGPAAWLGLFVALALAIALDQVSKGLAMESLAGRPFRVLVPGLLELRYSLNAGVAFGLGQGLPVSYRAPLLTGLTGLGVLVLLWMFARTGPRDWAERLAVALLAGGGLGNATDRVRHGEVIDFIHFRLGDACQLGTFNLADVLIAIGLVPLIASAFRPQTARSSASKLGRE